MLTASCRVMLPASFSRFRNSWMLHGHHKARVQKLARPDFDNGSRAEIVQQRGTWRLQQLFFPVTDDSTFALHEVNDTVLSDADSQGKGGFEQSNPQCDHTRQEAEGKSSWDPIWWPSLL
jgi:hypothetical protein